MIQPADYLHLMRHARMLFPGASIAIVYEEEIIHIDADGHRFTFEIGSDDDFYVFGDGKKSFMIPLMENPEDNEDLA